MALSLPSAELARIEAATRTFLSPLAAPSVDAWREEAMRVFADALGAETATFTLAGEPRVVVAHQMEDWVEQGIDTFTAGPWSGAGPSPEPAMTLFYDALVRSSVGAWDFHVADRLLGGQGQAWKTTFYNEVLAPGGARETSAIFVPGASGAGMLTAHGFKRSPGPGGTLPLLTALRPAFVAGLDALGRHAAHRHALDALDRPAAAFDADGRETHRTPALTAALAADPERERVEGSLRLLAAGLRALAFPRSGAGPAPLPVAREVATARGRYTLRGVLLAPGAFGGTDAFLVTVEPPGGPVLPPPDVIRARHGLTKREAEVALLLAEGLSNDALAERLFVSTHTARHHVEAILLKLDVNSRAAVAARLMQPV